MAEKLLLKNTDYHHCVFLNMDQTRDFAALQQISQSDRDREFERVTATELFALIQSHPTFSKHKYFIAGWSVYMPRLDALLSEEKKGAEFWVNKRTDPSEPINTYMYGKVVEIISCSRGDSTSKWYEPNALINLFLTADPGLLAFKVSILNCCADVLHISTM